MILLLFELDISLEGQSSLDLGFSSKSVIAGPNGKGNNEDALEAKKLAKHNSRMVSALRSGPRSSRISIYGRKHHLYSQCFMWLLPGTFTVAQSGKCYKRG